MRYFVKKINETGFLGDTDPSMYTGYEIDPKTGKAKKSGEDDEMLDKDLHTPDSPENKPAPAINVQAEAYKPGFVIHLVEAPAKAAAKPAGASTDTASKTATKTATTANPHTATKTSTDAYTQGNITVTGGAGAGATSVTISIPRGDGGDPAKKAGDANPHKKSKNKAESALSTLKAFQQIVQEDETIKMVWEDTTTGQRGYVTPALFVKVYSKMLVAEQVKEARGQDGSEQKPMSESKPNMALAHELLALGLVNNVKKTAQVLREENPMRKAMEIFYASKNSNANKDEVKYVPSVIKEGKAVLDRKPAPAPVVVEKPPVVEQKKKRVIYW